MASGTVAYVPLRTGAVLRARQDSEIPCLGLLDLMMMINSVRWLAGWLLGSRSAGSDYRGI